MFFYKKIGFCDKFLFNYLKNIDNYFNILLSKISINYIKYELLFSLFKQICTK